MPSEVCYPLVADLFDNINTAFKANFPDTMSTQAIADSETRTLKHTPYGKSSNWSFTFSCSFSFRCCTTYRLSYSLRNTQALTCPLQLHNYVLLALVGTTCVLLYLHVSLKKVYYNHTTGLFTDTRGTVELSTSIRNPTNFFDNHSLSIAQEIIGPILHYTIQRFPGSQHGADWKTNKNRTSAEQLIKLSRDNISLRHFHDLIFLRGNSRAFISHNITFTVAGSTFHKIRLPL